MLLGFSQTVARRFLIRSPGGALVRLMKFGKRFLAAQRAEYVYLDYKVRPTHLSFAAPSTRTRDRTLQSITGCRTLFHHRVPRRR